MGYGRVCAGCKCVRVTWAEQRKQYGRAMKRGMASQDYKAIIEPQCGKCMTKILKIYQKPQN